jgi:hypothetical protein
MNEEQTTASAPQGPAPREKVKLTGALNVAVIFGVAAIACTLILTPFLGAPENKAAKAVVPGQYDSMTTGSISQNSGEKRYIVRRSLLQETPGAVCIINSDGSSSGC